MYKYRPYFTIEWSINPHSLLTNPQFNSMTVAPAIYPSLRGKTVLITGGAEGIGAATVELFALQSCQVIFLDIARASA
jgi:hypothetical protein